MSQPIKIEDQLRLEDSDNEELPFVKAEAGHPVLLTENETDPFQRTSLEDDKRLEKKSDGTSKILKIKGVGNA